MEILAHAKRLEAGGRSICHLEVGEPSAPPPPGARDAVVRSIGAAQRYTHAKGRLELRQGLAGYYRAQHGMTVDPESIIVTMGSSAGFILAFLAAFAPSAKIAVTRPGYPGYLNTLAGLGYGAVEIPLSAEDGWHLRGSAIEEAYRRDPFEGLLFASPANPTGASVDRTGLQEIADTCKRLGVRLISDEIYHGLDYRGPSVSALEVTSDAIIINSFSKYYCMTGWRVGWMVLPDALLRKTEMLQQNLFISAPTLSQIAAEAALTDRDYCEAQKAGYAANRTLISEGLRELGFAAVSEADGAFYAYVDIAPVARGVRALQFCMDLVEVAGVAATPGIDFDRANGDRYVRFSFAGASETIREALERMGNYLARP